MKELNRMLGIKSKMLTTFHLQTDGQTKRVNQELEHVTNFIQTITLGILD